MWVVGEGGSCLVCVIMIALSIGLLFDERREDESVLRIKIMTLRALDK